MTHVLFVTTDKNTLEDFSLGMEIPQEAMHWASSGEEALQTVKSVSLDLVVADEQVGDMTGLEFIEKVVKINPMINSAAVSSLSEADYHEASEGLGVLKKIPVKPGREDGKALLEYLYKIVGYPA